MASIDPDAIYDTVQAAPYVGVAPNTLIYWRHAGQGPKAFRMGGRKVFYKGSDLQAWIDAQYADQQVVS
jgi:predicted DNA-binding transcriptional regulator AlpA